jgi:hypothetical protein
VTYNAGSPCGAGKRCPPMTVIRHADVLDPVHLHAARGAVQDEHAEAAFEFGVRLQEFEPQHLGRDGNGMING